MKNYIQKGNTTIMSHCKLHKNGIMIDPRGKVEVCCQIIPHFDAPRQVWETVFDWHQEYKSNGKDLEAWERSKTEWLDGCHGCRVDETRYGHSSRRIANNIATEFDDNDNSYAFAIINAGNICNLACKMCDSGPSSKWGSIARNNPNPWIEPEKLIEHQTLTASYVKKMVLTPNLRQLTFAGGEPLMNKVCEEYVEEILKKDIAKNIKFQMITNGTFIPSDTWIDAMLQFDKLELSISIDGTFDNYDYIRTGSSFDQVYNNVITILDMLKDKRENLAIDIAYCLQGLNAHKINQDILFWDEFYHKHIIPITNQYIDDNNYSLITRPHCITNPKHLSMSVLHPDLIEKYNIENFIEGFEYSQNDYEEFMVFNGFWDEINNTSLYDQNPDFFDENLYPDANRFYQNGREKNI